MQNHVICSSIAAPVCAEPQNEPILPPGSRNMNDSLNMVSSINVRLKTTVQLGAAIEGNQPAPLAHQDLLQAWVPSIRLSVDSLSRISESFSIDRTRFDPDL